MSCLKNENFIKHSELNEMLRMKPSLPVDIDLLRVRKISHSLQNTLSSITHSLVSRISTYKKNVLFFCNIFH